MHSSSSSSLNLKNPSLVIIILYSNLNKNCLNLLSFVNLYMNEKISPQSEKKSGNLFFQFLLPVGSVIQFPLRILKYFCSVFQLN